MSSIEVWRVAARRAVVRTALAATVACMVGCSSPTAASDSIFPAEMSAVPGVGVDVAPSVAADTGRLTVVGRNVLPVYCQTWQGTATGEPGRVFVTVAFREKRQPCPHVIGVFDYVLAVRGIPSGVYQVIVTVRELAGNDPPRDQTFQFNGVSIP